MLSGGMDTPRDIDRAAWEFFDQVIQGINNRPSRFPTDDAMAKSAGVTTTTFNEYKSGKKGHERPGFITVYKLAYILKGSPPCSIESPYGLEWARYQDAINKDTYGILHKLIAIITSEIEMDIEALVTLIDLYYKKLESSPLKKASENS